MIEKLTEEQVLKLTGKEFSKFAGEVLKTKHKMTPKNDEDWHYCKVCVQSNYPNGTPLTEYCPIPLTPDNGYKWRDWAVEKFTRGMFARILWEVYYSTESYGKISFTDWICSVAQPIHYIKAAVLCEMRTK